MHWDTRGDDLSSQLTLGSNLSLQSLSEYERERGERGIGRHTETQREGGKGGRVEREGHRKTERETHRER